MASFAPDGRVMIGPKSRLGLDEFAALYAAPGMDPMQRARDIHLTFPTEGKSVLERSWRDLGITGSPESYFATRAKEAPAALPGINPTPSVAAPSVIPDRNPTFANEVERNLAIATGAYDPAFASPARKINFEALTKIAADDRARMRARADELAPISLDTPQDQLRSQLTGDTLGLAKKFLIKQTGMNPDEYYRALPEARGELAPYVSPAGYGALEGTTMPSRLDRRVYNDPDFQRALQENPAEAAYAYKRLTGRALETDIKETLETRKTQVQVGRQYATRALSEGAYLDPQTGKWKVWNMAQPEEGIGLAQPRAARDFVDASEPQAQWLNTHYETIMGQPIRRPSMADQRYRQSVTNVVGNDLGFKVEKAKLEKKYGRSLTNEELARLASVTLKKRAQPDSMTGEGAASAAEFLMSVFANPVDIIKSNASQALDNLRPSPQLQQLSGGMFR